MRTAVRRPAHATSHLLAGPRGRRLLLDLLLDDRETWRPELESLSARDLAARLAPLPLPRLTEGSLIRALSVRVGQALYWQPQEPFETVLAAPPVVDALRHVAADVASSPLTDWWWSTMSSSQAQVTWADDDAPPAPVLGHPAAALQDDVVLRTQMEDAASTTPFPDAPADDASGAWWSTPSRCVPTSSRRLSDGSPVGLWCEEDGDGAVRAVVRGVHVPDDTHVLEIRSPEDWADLCRRHPLVVTRSVRHDWFCTTGRDGAWVMPDWAAVAADGVDGVHLPVASYLALAGRAIEVDDGVASVVAGWNPDETFWLSGLTPAGSDVVAWRFTPDEYVGTWEPGVG